MNQKPSRRKLLINEKYERNFRTGAWKYSEKYDAFFDTRTLAWIEEKCGDRRCKFCANRPANAAGVA